jgi:hypothetical protein
MSDEALILNPGSGSLSNQEEAADKVGDLFYQRVKLDIGADGESLPVST